MVLQPGAWGGLPWEGLGWEQLAPILHRRQRPPTILFLYPSQMCGSMVGQGCMPACLEPHAACHHHCGQTCGGGLHNPQNPGLLRTLAWEPRTQTTDKEGREALCAPQFHNLHRAQNAEHTTQNTEHRMREPWVSRGLLNAPPLSLHAACLSLTCRGVVAAEAPPRP